MKDFFKDCIMDNIWFKVLSLSAIILLFLSLLLPPRGVIDPSVIAASGELCGWGALWTVLVAMKRGKGITVHHGDTTIEVNGKKYKLEEENDDSSR